MKTNPTHFPADHKERMQRVLASFDGLSVGDGFGQCFFTSTDLIERWMHQRISPPPPWVVTDDTVMALSIVRNLKHYGRIEQDTLAKAFAEEFVREPDRGYGGMAQQILRANIAGMSWKAVARLAFGGQGSCGNGGAMRSAPIGAYFADDYKRVVAEAKISAEVTHAHPDGKTGAAAVALAAAWMVRESKPGVKAGRRLIEFVLEHLPQTETYHGLVKALGVPVDSSPKTAASILGNGRKVVASDTVPFCIWCVARHTDSYTEALWTTVSGLGDRDTTCAIVGGIVACGKPNDGIPTNWLKSREFVEI